MTSDPPIKRVMTHWPHSIEADRPLVEAQRMMRKYKIRHLPVTQGEALVGILTDRDIKLMLGPDFDYPPLRELAVRDVYAEPYVVDQDEPLSTVLGEMVRRHIGSALVTEDGHLAGIFTALDACRQLSLLIGESGQTQGAR